MSNYEILRRVFCAGGRPLIEIITLHCLPQSGHILHVYTQLCVLNVKLEETAWQSSYHLLQRLKTLASTMVSTSASNFLR